MRSHAPLRISVRIIVFLARWFVSLGGGRDSGFAECVCARHRHMYIQTNKTRRHCLLTVCCGGSYLLILLDCPALSVLFPHVTVSLTRYFFYFICNSFCFSFSYLFSFVFLRGQDFLSNFFIRGVTIFHPSFSKVLNLVKTAM